MEVPTGAAGVGEHPALPAPKGNLLPAQLGLGKEGTLDGEFSPPLKGSVLPPWKASNPAGTHKFVFAGLDKVLSGLDSEYTDTQNTQNGG